MNKLELMADLSKENGIKRSEAKTVVNMFFNEINEVNVFYYAN